MSTYKLYYFNGRGRGEICRLILAAAGQQFEDIRYELNDWPSHKGDMPLGQMPVLEYNGTKLPQSITIARFLAKKFQLAGKDDFDQAKIDAVADTISDLITKQTPVRREKDENKKQELMKNFMSEELPKFLENLETLRKMYGNGGPFFVSNQLTWADLFFHDIGFNLLQANETCLDKHPWLKQNRAEVEKQPRIAEYLKKRPQTPF